jgi:hypothetical protein
MQWCSWLRHSATSRKVEGSIPNGVVWSFHCLIPSGRTMALGTSQPLTEISTRDISWWIKAVGANCLEILGTSTFWSPKGLSGFVMG